MKESGREIKRAPSRERETVEEINLGLLERLQVSEAAANNTHTHTHTYHNQSVCESVYVTVCVGFIHSSFEHLGMRNSSIVHTSV